VRNKPHLAGQRLAQPGNRVAVIFASIRLRMSAAMPAWQADYADAAVRHYQDGDTLLQKQRYPNATHLFGLAAECALKTLLAKIPGAQGVPHRHLPKLRDDALRMLSRRSNNGVRQLLNRSDYMVDWDIANPLLAAAGIFHALLQNLSRP